MNLMQNFVEKNMPEKAAPDVTVGDTVRVHLRVKEGNRERIQVFEGTVIAKKHGGINETFTVRRISYGVGVEKVFPLYSPVIEKVETVRKGKVRRAKLYYLRDRVGKAAKVKEKLYSPREFKKGSALALPILWKRLFRPGNLVYTILVMEFAMGRPPRGGREGGKAP